MPRCDKGLIRKVSTIAPIKRGLKARMPDGTIYIYDVSTIAPIKRGLKGPRRFGLVNQTVVSTIAPIKRGLKGQHLARLFYGGLKFQPLPRLKGD